MGGRLEGGGAVRILNIPHPETRARAPARAGVAKDGPFY